MTDVWALIADPNTAEAGLHLLRERCARHPNNPRSFFDLANAYDLLGREEDAEREYETVRTLGLDGLSPEEREHWFVQFGSTLRLRGKLEASREVLQQGETAFPANPAMSAFRALTELADKRPAKASRLLLEAILRLPHPEIEHYRRALANYVAEIQTDTDPRRA